MDDNRINRNTFVQKLRLLETVKLAFLAKSGDECLERLKELSPTRLPQVIFMDLEMPVMDPAGTNPVPEQITEREKEILRHLVMGWMPGGLPQRLH